MTATSAAGTSSPLGHVPVEQPRFPARSTREQRAAIVELSLLSNLETWNVKRQVKSELLRAGLSSPRGKEGTSSAAGDVEQVLEASGGLMRLKNLIYEAYRQASLAAPAPPPGLTAAQVYAADSLDYVERAKLKWEKRIRQELDAMAAELGVPLQRARKEEAVKALPPEDQPIRFVYDDNDLLDVISGISNPNHAAYGSKEKAHACWGMIKVEVEAKDVEDLRDIFRDLDPSTNRHLGFDDDTKSALLAERSGLFRRALQVGYVPLLRTLSRRGVPHAMRPAVWKAILGVTVGEKEVNYLAHIHASLQQLELVTDELFRLDVTITSNDDNYFVFEELLSDTVAALSRDPWLVTHAAVKSQANEVLYTDSNLRQAAVFPPCGVVPFRGIVMYATPLCYLYANPPDLYFTYRALYAQKTTSSLPTAPLHVQYCCRLHTLSIYSLCYWYKSTNTDAEDAARALHAQYCCRLHTLSSNTGDIVQLSRQFERLLQATHPNLYYHLMSLGAMPLKLVFHWIVFAFAGYLDVDQVMAVWDRVLAWDSLLFVPVAAASILAFREKRLMECRCLQDVQQVLADATKIKVVLLVQLYLFGDTLNI